MRFYAKHSPPSPPPKVVYLVPVDVFYLDVVFPGVSWNMNGNPPNSRFFMKAIQAAGASETGISRACCTNASIKRSTFPSCAEPLPPFSCFGFGRQVVSPCSTILTCILYRPMRMCARMYLPQDLRERYACVELKASLPLVPFRETVVAPGQVYTHRAGVLKAHIKAYSMDCVHTSQRSTMHDSGLPYILRRKTRFAQPIPKASQY